MKLSVKGRTDSILKASVKKGEYQPRLVVAVNLVVCLCLSKSSYPSMAISLLLANVALLAYLSEQVVKETLVVIKNLGVQWERKKRNGKVLKVFYDASKVQDVLLNEIVTPWTVRTTMVLSCSE
jgi:ABC-type siderophore export system fused ATPase/permease subunit